MIKVGQIYKTYDGIMVITQINKHINSLRYDYIYNDGMVCDYMRENEVLYPAQNSLQNIQLGKKL